MPLELFKLTIFDNFPRGSGRRSRLVKLVSLNTVQPVLSEICNYSPTVVVELLEVVRE